MRAAASCPASSANLGPGFDVVALALELRCRVEARSAPEWTVTSDGVRVPPAAFELVRKTVAACGIGGSWSIAIESEIPIARGLGSSAALIVATAAAARAAEGLDASDQSVFTVAREVEGHPDNVAAAVWGGAVAVGPQGTVRALEVHPAWRVMVAVPAAELLTSEARRATRSPVTTAVASRTAARLLFLVEGLRTGDPDLLAEAAGDELHELRRAPLSHRTVELMAAAREAGAAHTAWSGAGPSALALVTDQTAPALRSVWQEILDHDGGTLLEPQIATRGLMADG